MVTSALKEKIKFFRESFIGHRRKILALNAREIEVLYHTCRILYFPDAISPGRETRETNVV